ncbi:hypothetical protein R3W88_023737 [Solanum pinnatisectum]|uniref:Fatty acyl-CoA reductase n=1 Tax=Solanum pinnatisectum TaxID=50273 RepID=A0AAV9LYC9_9SOLN|nr:hypothetical protein R3W88_023737 [Solanum pinnatisectum]
MLLSKNIFSLNTRELSPAKLFSKKYFSSRFEYSNNISSFENHKIARKKLFCMKSENVGHHQLKVMHGNDNVIGIVVFFEGKNILVTGATGFLAKALIEKMLRTTPKVNKIYLLIRIMESELFKYLEEMHGEYYKSFILDKLIPIVGNIYEPNLGMDIIATLDANVNGPYQLMMFAKKCKKLKLLMHYSTTFANGEREGLILEKPFSMGESITKEKITSISPFTNFPSLHVDNEMDLVSKLKNNITNNIGLEQIMAKLYGWQDTYTFTKAIGEMMINSMRNEIPILILRPSVITSSYKEPFPGWIQGYRVIDPSIFLYGKGELPALYCDQDTHVDVIPVDLVVNATMAAIAKHGYLQSPQLNIYHLATTFVNPVAIHQIFDYCYEYFTLFPFVNSEGDKIEVKEMKYFDKISDFSNYIWEVLSKQHKVQDLSEKELLKIQMRFERKVEFLNNFSKHYEPYGFYRGRFHTGNMGILMEEMSEEERKNFEIDASNINWKDYLTGIHISGVKKHVLEGKRLPISGGGGRGGDQLTLIMLSF